MKRRDFFNKSISGGVLPLLLNGIAVRALADNPLIQFLGKAGNEDRVLVLIQLNGGNDGLNTVIPLDQYSKLNAARSNIMIAESKVLALTGTQATGLHPSMSEIRSLYDNGKVSIIHSVGYPNPDFSHFRSTDIWLSASDSNQYLNTGWMGRYLDTKFPNYPTGYPNATNPDPPAIQIGAMISPALQGDEASMGMSITDPTAFYQFVSGTVDPAPNTPAGHELTFIRLVAQQTQLYSSSVKTAASKATNKSTLYPAQGQNTLSDQLKIVAQLIAGGLKTRVYVVSIGGFDTHASQVDSSGTDKGTHATLLQRVSQAVNAFQDDLKLLEIEDRVLGMTFSEFGRRVQSNGSTGTDHGAAAPLFIFGKNVVGGMYGTNPLIPTTTTVNDNVPMQFDFRSVYASILKNWFEVNDADLNTVMLKSYPEIPFLKAPATSTYEVAGQAQIGTVDNYPNPATTFTNIRFSTSGGNITIKLFNAQGKEIATVADSLFQKGSHEVQLDVSGFTNGVYYYQVQSGSNQTMKMMLVGK